MLRKKIFNGLSWGLAASAAIASAFLIFVPIINKWSLFVVFTLIAFALSVGLVKGLRSQEVVCNNCETAFRLMSSQNRCPECGSQFHPISL